MIRPNPANTAARNTKRANRLATVTGAPPACVVCGITDPTVLEAHHLAGRKNDLDLTMFLCRNHHALATEQLLTIGVSMDIPETSLDAMVATLAGIGLALMDMGATLIGWSRWLTALSDTLHATYPGWAQILATLPSHRILTPMTRDES